MAGWPKSEPGQAIVACVLILLMFFTGVSVERLTQYQRREHLARGFVIVHLRDGPPVVRWPAADTIDALLETSRFCLDQRPPPAHVTVCRVVKDGHLRVADAREFLRTFGKAVR